MLCKGDLVSEMVYEFPSLQGVMGYYYAINDGLSNDTALVSHVRYLRINRAQDYNMLMYSQGYVIADFKTRKNIILKAMFIQ